MTRKYDITDINDRIDVDRSNWLKATFNESQYKIVDDGWLISSYSIIFTDPSAELFYNLRWS